MIISSQYNSLFVHIPRNGGASVKQMMGEEHYDILGNMVNDNYMNIEQLKDNYPKEFQAYYKWTIIRNPWDREVSLYNALKGKVIPESTTFRDYLNSISQQNLSRTIYRNQIDYFMADGNIQIDRIIRMEFFESSFLSLAKTINLPVKNVLHINQTKEPYFKLYDAKNIDLVRKIREKDIEFLNYDYPY